MSADAARTNLTLSYVLHHLPYRDTSRILEVLTREHGRLTVFARGVRGPKARLGPLLEPFRPVLLSWSGRGEAPQLTRAEPAASGSSLPLAAAHVMGGFYLNELVMKLTSRHDPHPRLFDAYHETLERLKDGGALAPALRLFEKHLLEEIGYGVDLEAESGTGRRLSAECHYQFWPAQGFVAAAPEAPGAFLGGSLLSLAAERFTSTAQLEDARRLLRLALEHCLEGRELKTRTVARSLARSAAALRK